MKRRGNMGSEWEKELEAIGALVARIFIGLSALVLAALLVYLVLRK